MSASAEPIPSLAVPAPSLAPNPGGAASAKPISNAKKPPQHPFMGANPWNNIHNDAWMTDAYHGDAPLGRNSTSFSGAMPVGICASVTFDSRGRINTICPSRDLAPEVRMIDPESLEILASYTMPFSPPPPGTEAYQNFAGGGYFYSDRRGRLLVPTQNNRFQIIGQTDDGSDFRLLRDFDLSGIRRSRNRADQLGASRLQRANLVRRQADRQGRNARPEDTTGEDPQARRIDRELVHGRQGRRLRRHQPAHVPSASRIQGSAARFLERRLSKQRQRPNRDRQVPAAERPRPSSTGASSRSPTTPIR